MRLDLPDLSLTLRTDRGVFSADRVDPGTKVLLDTDGGPPLPPTGDLLDLGCGYGPIALALATRAPGCRVWALDVNGRALDLTRANAAAAGLGNVVVARPEDVPREVRFAAVWSNPPVRVGKRALHEMLARWLGRLAAGGHARLVVHKHLGADSLHRWLEGEGWAVERLRSRLGYRVLAIRPQADGRDAPGPAAPEADQAAGPAPADQADAPEPAGPDAHRQADQADAPEPAGPDGAGPAGQAGP